MTLKHAFFIGFLSVTSHAADIISSGDWAETITAANLTSGAGSNLQVNFESATGITTLTILNTTGAWTVRARRSEGQGHGDVTVHIKRTSAGSGTGDVTGGTAFTELTTTDTEIFTGSEARNGISLQFKLTGLSSKVPPGTYFSNIIFTVQ